MGHSSTPVKVHKKVRFGDSQGKPIVTSNIILSITNPGKDGYLEDSCDDAVKELSQSIPIPDRGHVKPRKMADPFEVRMRFTNMLQHLNASVTSSQKAAHYALKYRDMDEDLHSCILEQLERVRSFPSRRKPSLA